MGKGRWYWALGIGLIIAVHLGDAAAQEVMNPPSFAAQVSKKLGRGLANVITAPLELIRVPMLLGRREGGLSAVTVGVIRGVGAAVIREGAGLLEAVTCFVPYPKYAAPLVKPEFVYVDGAWAE